MTAFGLPGSVQFSDDSFDFSHKFTLITNFHLPKSSLLMLVSAFAGHEATMGAYHTAVRENYRFFSFGDAMFIT